MIRGFKQIYVLARTPARVWRAKYIAGYGHRIRSGSNDFRGPVQRDAANGDNRLAGKRAHAANEVDADDGIGPGFGGSAKYWADGDVVRRTSGCAFELRQIMRRDANPFFSSNYAAGGFYGHILLSNMNSGGIRQGGDIGAVVHNKRDALSR
jgi:hypothetical protein